MAAAFRLFRPAAAIALAVAGSASVVLASGPLTTDPDKMNREWIGICPTEWSAALDVLKDFRISQGRTACVWTVGDLDATYGGHGPEQLRQALQDARASWSVKPRWVLLASDQNLLLSEPCPYCLSDWAMYCPELGHWEDYIRGAWPYMDLDDDGVPEQSVGRVPASSPAELSAYIAKVVTHDTDIVQGTGYDLAGLLEYDASVSGRDGSWARALGDSLYANWMTTGNKKRLRCSDLGYSTASRDSVTALWNRGPGLVVELGTSSNWLMLGGFWQVCSLYYPWTVGQLGATNRFPALLGLSCGLTATDNPTATECESVRGLRPLVEQLLLLRTDAGASVVIGPTRNTYQYYDFLAGKHLLTRYYAGDYTWGEVFSNAMQAMLAEDPSAHDHVYQYVLEGDPAAMAHAGGVLGTVGPAAGRFELGRPAPNPARRATRISYGVARPGRVALSICDVAGRRIRRLVDREETPGAYTVVWDLRSDLGEPVPPGAYFVRIRVADAAEVRRVIVIH